MYSKSQAAFIMSARKFFSTRRVVYFWTFTFKRVMPDWWYPVAWKRFCTDLHNHYHGFCQGLRVIEIHPGGHGLHYHAILDARLSVHIVRRFGNRVGMGRVQVEVATVGAAEYLAKYLAKRNFLTKGMRKWGTIGGFKAVKARDVVIDSCYHRNQRLLGQGRQMTYEVSTWIFQQSILWGDWADWPNAVREQCDVLLVSCREGGEAKIKLDNKGKPDRIVSVWRTPRKPATTLAGVKLLIVAV
jgi:hypothetical protein